MASVQKRTRNGRTRWVARWRDPDGTDRSQTFDRERDAKDHAHRAEAAARHRPDITQQRRTLTVGEWLDRWLDDHVAPRVAARQLAPRTAEGYESTVRVHLKPALGDLLLADLRISDVDRFVTGQLARGYAARSVKQHRACLSASITAATRAELIDRHVVQLSTPPPTPPDSDVSRFDDDEFDRIIIAAGEHRLGSAIVFGLATGLRRSEIAGLTWSAVDLEAGTAEVRATLHRVSAKAARVAPTGLVESGTKNRPSHRTVRLAPAVVQLLRRHKAAQAAEQLAADTWIGCDHVWTSTIGTPLEGRQIARALEQILAAAGVDRDGGQVVHELRRTWASRLRERGVLVEDLMTLGGWASPDVPLRFYAGSSAKRLGDAAEAAADGIS